MKVPSPNLSLWLRHSCLIWIHANIMTMQFNLRQARLHCVAMQYVCLPGYTSFSCNSSSCRHKRRQLPNIRHKCMSRTCEDNICRCKSSCSTVKFQSRLRDRPQWWWQWRRFQQRRQCTTHVPDCERFAGPSLFCHAPSLCTHHTRASALSCRYSLNV